MGLGGKGAPSSPDFQQMARLQGASSQAVTNQQTAANRPNQANAFGATSSWVRGPNGEWTQQSSLGGGLGTAAQGLEGQIAGLGQAPNLGPLDTGTSARDQAISGVYSQAASRLDPQWNQREEQERAMLANQGLDPGSEAYANEMGNFNRARNDAYSSAMNNAIGAGTAAQQATFGENLASRQQQLNERNMPLEQLGALNQFTGQQGFQGAGAAQPIQYLPAAMAQYQGALQGYGINQAGKNSTMSGLGSLGGSLGAAAIMA